MHKVSKVGVTGCGATQAFEESSRTDRPVALTSTCEQPKPLASDLPAGIIAWQENAIRDFPLKQARTLACARKPNSYLMKTIAISHSLLLLFLLVPCGSALSENVGKPAEPKCLLPGGADKWQLVWSDEFDGTDADLDKKWISQNGPSGHILCSRWRENAKVADGTLKLINKKESRGGQEWTSGNIWTAEKFQYGYFECRYKYAAATGTNNSFWLMTQGPEPAEGKRFEIDINEGHFPNRVNTNIHNWSDIKVVNGKKTHPSSSKSFPFGLNPSVTIQLEIPVRTRKIRFTSRHSGFAHLGEFRIYNVNPAGYPDPFSPTADSDKPGLVNYARDPATTVTASGFLTPGADTSKNLVDGKIDTRWTSQKDGEKSLEFVFPEERTVGCIQFLNGWGGAKNWKGLLEDYKIAYHDGTKWVEMSAFNIRDGAYNFARDYQVYGLEWTPEELVFYFNGKELRREKNTFCHSPAPVWLSLAIIKWGGAITDAIDGTAMEVDYVRVYKRKQ